MKTKEKIIVAAVKLFNSYGVTKVSLRQIAAALNISIGNLTYHYKNKEVIISEIYHQMDSEMANVVYPGAEEINLYHYDTLLHRISTFQKQYKFFYMDLLEIYRQYPQIIIRYRKTISVRREQTKLLFTTLLAKKLIHNPVDSEFYQRAYSRNLG